MREGEKTWLVWRILLKAAFVNTTNVIIIQRATSGSAFLWLERRQASLFVVSCFVECQKRRISVDVICTKQDPLFETQGLGLHVTDRMDVGHFQRGHSVAPNLVFPYPCMCWLSHPQHTHAHTHPSGGVDEWTVQWKVFDGLTALSVLVAVASLWLI